MGSSSQGTLSAYVGRKTTAAFKAFIGVQMMMTGCILAPQVGLLAVLPFPSGKATLRKLSSRTLGLLAFTTMKTLTCTHQFCPFLGNGSNKQMSQQPH